jgi:hypothetical protein
MKQGGSADINLTDNTTYYVRVISSSKIAFYTTAANAIADTSRIALTSTGGETHYINSMDAAVFNDRGAALTINVSGGDSPSVRDGYGSSTSISAGITITFSGFTIGTEIRVYIASSGVEADGIETTISATWAASLQASIAYNIVALLEGKEPIRLENQTYTSSQSVNLNQKVDRNFRNP